MKVIWAVFLGTSEIQVEAQKEATNQACRLLQSEVQVPLLVLLIDAHGKCLVVSSTCHMKMIVYWYRLGRAQNTQILAVLNPRLAESGLGDEMQNHVYPHVYMHVYMQIY